MTSTRAWLIGAGPGDVDLLTVKAAKAIALADVILVDDLVNPEILVYARGDAEIVQVGKRGGRPSATQANIIDLMLLYLHTGKRVARLKGGDPFVFGRGGEELQALVGEGINTEVINGITAGIAAPSAIGIPVTHRDHTQGVIFVTGHHVGGRMPNWPALVATNMTLVVYMGISRLDDIAKALLEARMDPDTPCAIIQSATLPEQRHGVCALNELAELVEQEAFASPAIVVIGSVVGSRMTKARSDWQDAMA